MEEGSCAYTPWMEEGGRTGTNPTWLEERSCTGANPPWLEERSRTAANPTRLEEEESFGPVEISLGSWIPGGFDSGSVF